MSDGRISLAVMGGAMSNVIDRTSQVKNLSPEDKFVNDAIKNNCIVVFAKSECPYSQMAKDVFDSMKVPYKAIDIDLRDDGKEIQQILSRRTSAETVPRVFINGMFIGGGEETSQLHDNGKLYELVLRCNLSQLCQGFCPKPLMPPKTE